MSASHKSKAFHWVNKEITNRLYEFLSENIIRSILIEIIFFNSKVILKEKNDNEKDKKLERKAENVIMNTEHEGSFRKGTTASTNTHPIANLFSMPSDSKETVDKLLKY